MALDYIACKGFGMDDCLTVATAGENIINFGLLATN